MIIVNNLFQKISRQKYFAIILLAIFTFIIYAKSLVYDFSDISDILHIVSNPNVNSGLSWDGLVGAFITPGHDNLWYPFSTISHAITTSIFGLHAWGHHLVNIMLHIFNSVFVYIILLKLYRSNTSSLAIAMLFAVHPVQVETVVWIHERTTLLSTFFFLASINSYLVYIKKRGSMLYSLTLGLFLGGVLAKSYVVTLPVVLILIDICILKIHGIKRVILNKIPFLGIALVFGLVTLQLQGDDFVHSTKPLVTLLTNLYDYTKIMINPFLLNTRYRHPALGRIMLWAISIIITVLIPIVLLPKNRKTIGFGLLFFLATISPVLIHGQINNWYLYIPSIGLITALFFTIKGLFAFHARSSLIIVLVICIFLASFTFIRLNDHQNALTMYEKLHKEYPEEISFLYNLGWLYRKSAQFDKAIPIYKEILRREPGAIEYTFWLASAYENNHDIKNAIKYYNLLTNMNINMKTQARYLYLSYMLLSKHYQKSGFQATAIMYRQKAEFIKRNYNISSW